MAETSTLKDSTTSPNAGTKPKVTPKTIIHEYLLERLSIYQELRELQRQVSLGPTLPPTCPDGND
jgi:hypothetical protein